MSINVAKVRKFPLQSVLVIPFVIQIFVAVGLTGWLSLRNGQKAVNDVSAQLRSNISDRVKMYLDNYLEKPFTINRLNTDAIARRELSFDLKKLNPKTDKLLWQQMQFFDNVSWISLCSVQGDLFGIERRVKDNLLQFYINNNNTGFYPRFYKIDSQGNRTGNIEKSTKKLNNRARIEAWYSNAEKLKKSSWSEIYPEFTTLQPQITAASLVYNDSRKVQGFIGTTFSLKAISKFLNNLKIGRTGQVFIIEKSGFLVASSTQQKLFTLQNKKDAKPQRLKALDSKDKLISATAQTLTKNFKNLNNIKQEEKLEFTISGQLQFIQVLPFHDKKGLDWLVVVVVPESDFMELINANTRTTILLCLLALGIATGLGIIAAHLIAQPIRGLNKASAAIASGELEQNIPDSSIQELAALGKSFNQMSQQLKDYYQTLEQRVQDRTAELVVAKEKADVANQAKSTFIANMSHELRSPLNAILGFSQIMTRSQSLNPEQQENLTIISRSGEHLLNLIDNVLDLSKIEAGKTTFNPKNFDLHGLINDIHDMFQMKSEEKGLQLLIEYEPDLPRYVHTDDVKLRQVIINLINNAIKFTEEGGVCLRVSSRQNHQKISEIIDKNHHIIHFEIEDSGAGIAAEELGNLFEAFTQTASGKQAQEGTGLGLRISRQFVELMEGEITVKSQVGQGTTFLFDIQVTEVEASAMTSQEPSRHVIALEPNQPRYRILIVDDKPTNRQLLIKLLSPLGFELKEASNGQEAVNIWETWEPQLIWMDMRMPVMDGYTATQKIKAHTKGQATAIIALTASVLEEERAVVLSAGCDDFLRKPFREAEIFKAMNKHIGVTYIYEDLIPINTDIKQIREALSVEAMAEIPREILIQLRDAIIVCDIDLMLTILKQISSKNLPLAQAIEVCLENFEYKKVLNLISVVQGATE
ncbi:hybrid sensor histidine kinase/response regulator [Microcoleus sp. herbarium12]|uniref:hybrid sensor histidine kinase/response regulator n=1 Tax=Microcoleus sp. herbarium12 TaxID=3055437 RepID=UPI002FD6F1A7